MSLLSKRIANVIRRTSRWSNVLNEALIAPFPGDSTLEACFGQFASPYTYFVSSNITVLCVAATKLITFAEWSKKAFEQQIKQACWLGFSKSPYFLSKNATGHSLSLPSIEISLIVTKRLICRYLGNNDESSYFVLKSRDNTDLNLL